MCLRECVPGSLFQCYECPLAPHLVGAGRSNASNVLTRPPGLCGSAPQRDSLLCPAMQVQLTGWLPAKLIAQSFLNQSSPAARDHRARATFREQKARGHFLFERSLTQRKKKPKGVRPNRKLNRKEIPKERDLFL